MYFTCIQCNHLGVRIMHVLHYTIQEIHALYIIKALAYSELISFRIFLLIMDRYITYEDVFHISFDIYLNASCNVKKNWGEEVCQTQGQDKTDKSENKQLWGEQAEIFTPLGLDSPPQETSQWTFSSVHLLSLWHVIQGHCHPNNNKSHHDSQLNVTLKQA